MKLLYNAKVYTLNEAHPTASAVAIDRGRILAVGASAALQREFEGRAEPQDLSGRVVIPGLTDAHIHLEEYALGLHKVDCETLTLADCLQRVADQARLTPASEWVLGHGWNHNYWPDVPPPLNSPISARGKEETKGGREPGYGSAADLNAIAPEHPVYLTAKSLHAGWANSAALCLAGITANTPDPVGGRIGRDGRGNPNGILYESAMELIGLVIPELTLQQLVQAMAAAQPVLWRMGLTGAHDFDGPRSFSALQILHQHGDLHLRVVKSIPLPLAKQAVELGLRTGFGDDLLRIGSVKGFADGALGPQTAAMIQPYEESPSNDRGMLLLDAEELYEQGRAAVTGGLSLAIHAIGDRANHEVLKAFAQLREYEQTLSSKGSSKEHPLRHRIEHVQLLHPDDAPRLAQLGVIASMQPIHAISDMGMADRYWGERAAFSYAWQTQLAAGARLAFGSDAPVESPNPFWGLHAAVTRRHPDGTPGLEGWYPEQRLSVAEALRAYTSGAAYAAGMEDRLGKLAAGYLADLLVLDNDPFTCDPAALYDLRPTATMVGGEWVWQSD